MSHTPADDDARDAHLLAALRHAPDRDVRPPAQLTEAILGQASRAAASSRTRRPAARDGLRAAWARLWQPAPMAAFGTLAVATVIGVMWGAQNLPDATPSLRSEPAAAPGNDAGVTGGTTAAAPLPRAALPEVTARETVTLGPRVTSPPPLPTATGRPAAKTADAAQATPAAPEAARQQALQETEARHDAAGAVASRAPPSVALTPAPAPTEAMQRSASPRRDARERALADAVAAPERARSETAAAALGAAVPATASPLALAAAEIDAATHIDAARVRWRLDARRLAAHDAARRDWWSALARTTQGRWQPAATGSATGAEGPALTLLIDGAPRGSLGFEPRAIVWRDADGVAWRAPVAADTLREWQAAIALW